MRWRVGGSTTLGALGSINPSHETHLIDCARAGYAIEIAHFVSDADRTLIETAIAKHGTGKLKTIHDSLPATVTYNMIRFVIAAQVRLQKAAP